MILTALDFSSLPSSFSGSPLPFVERPCSFAHWSLQARPRVSLLSPAVWLLLWASLRDVFSSWGVPDRNSGAGGTLSLGFWLTSHCSMLEFVLQCSPVLCPHVVVAWEFVCGSRLGCNKRKKQLASPEDVNCISKLPCFSFWNRNDHRVMVTYFLQAIIRVKNCVNVTITSNWQVWTGALWHW